MIVTPSDTIISLKKYQDDFIFSEERYPALVSAWGTGKTMCLIEKICNACEKFASNLILVLRKEFVDLRDSTIKDWNKNTGIIVNSSRDAIFKNGSIVMFRHAEELSGNNLNNINLGGFGIEQGEELDTDEVFFKLQGRLRRCLGCGKPENPITKKRQCICKHFGAVIANTAGHNWVYNLWKINAARDAEYKLWEANSFENEENLPIKTIEDWKKLIDKNPKIYNRFVMNSWDEEDVVDIIINPSHVRAATERKLILNYPLKNIVSIDVARYGDDRTVMYAFENGKVIGKSEHEKKDTMETVGRALLFSRQFKIDSFAVDEIGVGGGVVDRLRELGKKVKAVNSAGKSDDRFYNIRAEMYDYAAKMFCDGLVQLDPSDTELIEQLSWARYKEVKSNGVFLVEAKDDIKKRYRRSPDNADAFIMGLWAQKFIDGVGRDNDRRDYGRNYGWNGGTYIPRPVGSSVDFQELDVRR